MTTENEDIVERSANFTVSMTWERSKPHERGLKALRDVTCEVLLSTARAIQAEAAAVGGDRFTMAASGWWTGTIKSPSGEIVTYRWRVADDATVLGGR